MFSRFRLPSANFRTSANRQSKRFCIQKCNKITEKMVEYHQSASGKFSKTTWKTIEDYICTHQPLHQSTVSPWRSKCIEKTELHFWCKSKRKIQSVLHNYYSIFQPPKVRSLWMINNVGNIVQINKIADNALWKSSQSLKNKKILR